MSVKKLVDATCLAVLTVELGTILGYSRAKAYLFCIFVILLLILLAFRMSPSAATKDNATHDTAAEVTTASNPCSATIISHVTTMSTSALSTRIADASLQQSTTDDTPNPIPAPEYATSK